MFQKFRSIVCLLMFKNKQTNNSLDLIPYNFLIIYFQCLDLFLQTVILIILTSYFLFWLSDLVLYDIAIGAKLRFRKAEPCTTCNVIKN